MHLELRSPGKRKNSLHKLGKQFWVPVFALFLAVGLGAYSIVRAITSAGDATTISISNNYRGYTYDENAIYYGINEKVTWKPWSTRWYNVNGNDAMCMQASRTQVVGYGTAAINTTNVKQIMLATVPSYSAASVAAGGPDYYSLFASSYNWNSKTTSITNLVTRDNTEIEYSSSDSRAHINPSGEETVKYTDYYYGCNSFYSSGCACPSGPSGYTCSKTASDSLVDSRDAIFAIGHMAVSGVYSGDYYALSPSDIAIVQGVASDINAWFSYNYPNAADEYEAYATWVDADHQTVGWLEYKGTPTPPDPTRIRICKKSTDGTMLPGATFAVDLGETIGYYTTKASNDNGCTDWIDVGDVGTVNYEETNPPTGYVLYDGAQVCTLTVDFGDNECWAHDNEQEELVSARIKIKKVDAEDSSKTKRGKATIVGAKFCVYDAAHSCASPNTTITIGSSGTGTSSALPEGTYTIEEKKAPTGYNLLTETRTVEIASADAGTTKDITTNPFSDTIKKGTVKVKKLRKSYDGTTSAFAGISFNIVNNDDATITYTLGPTGSDGTASLSGIIYGDYTATEISGTNNAAYEMQTFTFSITDDGQTIDNGDIVNELSETPAIETDARNSSSTAASPNKKIEISASASVTDRVRCTGLTPNAKYRLTGKLYDLANSSTVITSGTKEFTATASGTCDVDVILSVFNSGNYLGKTLSVTQLLERENGSSWVQVMSVHNSNLQDTREQVEVENISLVTTATSERSSDNKKLAVGPVKIIDVVKITGLMNGTSYKLYGRVCTTTNCASGTEVANKTDSFTMTAATGAEFPVTVDFVINSSAYFGQSLHVVMQLQTSSGTEIITHTAPTDNSETLTVLTPEITTTAIDNIDDGTPKNIGVGAAQIKDTVTYTGLVAGQQYTLKGKLVDASTGADLTGLIEHPFNATGENNTTGESMIFAIDTASLRGKNIVVYEYLYYGNNQIASHVSQTDAGQTVTVDTPTVGTTAVDNADGDKLLEVDEGIKIKDTVAYTGLIAGQNYTFVMKVVQRSNPDPDHPIVTTTFDNWTAPSPSGTYDFVSNAFDSTSLHDANLKGLDLVVYEYLYYGSTLIGSHEDASGDSSTNPQIVTVKTPTIGTAAADWKNGTSKLGVGRTTVTDTVTYTNLVPGKSYKLSGTLMDKSTGQPAKDKDNNPIIATTTFTPTVANCTDISTGCAATLTFNIFDTTFFYDFTASNQKEYVVFERLYKTNIEIANHEDLNDSGQTVQIATPKIQTFATYQADGGNLLGVGNVIMEDIVKYEGLVEGDYYTIHGYIVDPETGDIVNIDDTYFEGYKTFKAGAKGEGQVSLEITINTAPFQGRSFVVYEELYRSPRDGQNDDRLLAEHKEALDEGPQTIKVKVIKIETVAKDKTDNDNVLAYKPNQVIIDTVHYDGLLRNKRYTLYGYLWDKTDHAPLLDSDGKRIEAYSTFVTLYDEDFGDVEMEFTLDATDLPGHEIVVFEYLFDGKQEDIPLGDDGYPKLGDAIKSHADEENPDPNQTVRVVMRASTQATDLTDGDQIIGIGNAKVKDMLKYEGATMGETYKAKGWLVYGEDFGEHRAGDRVKAPVFSPRDCSTLESEEEREACMADQAEGIIEYDKEYVDVEAERIFVIGDFGDPDDEGIFDTTGFVKLIFEFDSRELAGAKLVVYEELYLVGERDELVAEHKEIDDADQTVTVTEPSIHTVATDLADGDKELLNDADVMILDTVEYRGLVPGTTYTLYGVLVDKNTGERVSGGITENTYTFTADREHGTEEIEFSLNTTGMQGKEIVVFETLYVGETPEEENEIAEHKDLNDSNQTVWVKTPAPNTGAFTRFLEGAKQSGVVVFIAGGIVMSLGGYFVISRRSRRKKFSGEIKFE